MDETKHTRVENAQESTSPERSSRGYGLGEEIDMHTEDRRPATEVHPRASWDEDFQRMAERGDDTLLDPEMPATTGDSEEWAW